MSPVSKGRKGKKRGSRRSGTDPLLGWQPDAVGEADVVRERPEWFAESIEKVLDGSAALLAATSPRAMEQATCELIGQEVYRAIHEERSGLRFTEWAVELAAAAAARVRDAEDLGGEWWLLHGIAGMAPPGLRSVARYHINSLMKTVRRHPRFPAQPSWLGLLHLIKLTGQIWLMRNAYGTRFAVIAGYAYPHGKDPSVFLIDIDACGLVETVHAGAFDDVTQAAAAWRALVGDTADGVEPVEVRTGEQLGCLVYCEIGGDMVLGEEPRDLADNWFRLSRSAHDIMHLMRKREWKSSMPESLYHDLDTEPMVTEFTTWYTDRHGTAPDPEAVEALAEEWLEGKVPETRYLISPHRSRHHLELIDDVWIPDDPVTMTVKSLLVDWTRWLGERSGLPADLIDRAIAEIGVTR